MENSPILKVKKLFPDSLVPRRSFETDSGLDLTLYRVEKEYNRNNNLVYENKLHSSDQYLIPSKSRVLANTGISATVGKGYEIQIRPRSGLALKNGLTVLNTPGTVDESYRGPICVILYNSSESDVLIKKEDRIAQMVVCPVTLSDCEIVEDLDTTDRGEGGFGHTGR